VVRNRRPFYGGEDVNINSGLRSVNLGHGLNPTWFHADGARSLSHLDHWQQALKIPIDHIFVSKNVRVDQVITLPSGVSDHRKFWVGNPAVLGWLYVRIKKTVSKTKWADSTLKTRLFLTVVCNGG